MWPKSIRDAICTTNPPSPATAAIGAAVNVQLRSIACPGFRSVRYANDNDDDDGGGGGLDSRQDGGKF
jgi:hypothetical protein